ncbi:holo-ACP synthase [Kamptonema cortianum]|nr:holo-ACP synthase [Geitlerinema splendidum]MDK3157616.1 holo-ACP synthase [Kamptonema cortianum]
MIVGIGVDIVSLERIEEAMRRPTFVKRILTTAERSRQLTPQYVAGRWAAKEAIKKCLPKISSWHDIEIATAAEGEPLPKIVREGLIASGMHLHISISHERDHSVAVAILESVPQ